MKKNLNIIKKYNKTIFKISLINNFTNFMSYNFFVLSSDFVCIQEKIIAIYLWITDIPRKSHFQGSWSTKIKSQAKIDNFAFKNSNIIIEGLFWKRKN